MEAADDSSPTIETPPEREGVGAMLRARRLELSLSQSDVANMVKLPARRIEAMEQERWEELPDGPFLRGFLRNIARALKLDSDQLMQRVDASLMHGRSPESILVPPTPAHAMLPRRSGPADDRLGGRALVYGAFAFALIATLIAWSGTNSFDHLMTSARSMIASRSDSTPAPAASIPVSPVEGKATQPTDAALSATAPLVASGTDSATTPVPATPSAAAAQPASALSLLFHFNEESWVEVRSADGKVLLQRLNAAGSEQTVDGAAPYTLIVGNAKGVQLTFRGQPVDLAPYTRDQVARFTLS